VRGCPGSIALIGQGYRKLERKIHLIEDDGAVTTPMEELAARDFGVDGS